MPKNGKQFISLLEFISVWFDPENYIFAATENQIYYTKDKGINWKSFKIPNRINLPNHLYYKNNFSILQYLMMIKDLHISNCTERTILARHYNI